MIRFSRSRIATTFLLPALLFTHTACVNDIINDLGVPLPGSVPASTLRAVVAETAFTSFVRGALAYCTDYSGLCNDGDDEIYASAAIARSIIPDNLPIQDRQWFSSDRVNKCVENIDEGVQNQVFIYLKVTETSAENVTGSESAVTPDGFKDSLPGAAIFAADAAEDCLDG